MIRRVPAEQRREKLNEWMNALRRVVDGERTDDPVLMALADTQKTFNIPLELLEKLVQGTAMDLPPQELASAEPPNSRIAVRNLRATL